MRRILLLTICIPLLFSSCKKENEDINNNPSNTSILVGYGINNSEVYKSTDGGKNWQKVAYRNFQELDFLSEEIGYAIDQNRLWKTMDGGSTWTELDVAIDTLTNGILGGTAISKIQAINENIIFQLYPNTCFFNFTSNTFFCGAGTIIKTTDGGVNYSALSPNFDANGIYQDGFTNMYFMNEEIGWASNYYKLWKTTDGGVTWNIIDQMPSYSSYDFVSENIGFLIGPTFLYKTTDGGLSWNIQDQIDFNCFDFVSENIGYGSNDNYTFKTIDGGLTWDTVSTMSFNPISFIQE